MSLDQVVLSSITAAISLLGTEYLKGAASEAGKSTWAGVKSLFGWSSDPDPKDIPAKVSDALVVSPELAVKVLQLLRSSQPDAVARLIGNLYALDSKVVVAHSIETLNM